MAEHYRDLIRTLMRNGFSFKRQGAGSDEIWWNRSSGGEVTLDRNIGSRAAATTVLVEAGIEKAEKPSAAAKPAAKAPAKSAAKAPAKAPAKKAAKAKAAPKQKSAAKKPAKAKAKPAAKAAAKSTAKSRARSSKK